MPAEQEIVETLRKKFAFFKDEDSITIQKTRRIFTKPLPPEEFEKVINFMHDEMGFYRASHVVGFDEGENFVLAYLLLNKDSIIVSLKEKTPRENPKVKSFTSIYPSLTIHERELVDLYGIEVSGIPEGPSYPLPDGWPKGNYPMRKDWNPKYFDHETMTYNPPAEEAKKPE